MSDPVLSIRGLRRTYRSGDKTLTVLNGVDLDVRPGEIVGLIGPSGSGKSSLLHAAGLLEHPDAGQIIVEGRDCSNLSDRQRTRVRLATIGFVYQAHHLLAEFTALDNVALPQMIAGRSRRAARARASEVLSSLGLAERVDHQPAQMSGGEQQRVAIAAPWPMRRGCCWPTSRPAISTGTPPARCSRASMRSPGRRASRPWSPPTTWTWPGTWTASWP